jgi:hypothetical protein
LNEKEWPMTDQAFLDFISKDDNLDIALDVMKKLSSFMSDMHKRFWNLFNESMKNRLMNSPYNNAWKYAGHPAKASKKGWATTYFLPKETQRTVFLKTAIGQETDWNDYQLYWGVRWNETQKENIDQYILIELRNYLSAKGMTQSNIRWVGWNELTYHIYSPVFLRRIYLNPNELIEELTALYWDFFVEVEPLISAINNALD